MEEKSKWTTAKCEMYTIEWGRQNYYIEISLGEQPLIATKTRTIRDQTTHVKKSKHKVAVHWHSVFRSTLCQEVEVVALDMKFYLLIGISLAAMVMGLEAKRFVVVVDDELHGADVTNKLESNIVSASLPQIQSFVYLVLLLADELAAFAIWFNGDWWLNKPVIRKSSLSKRT